MHLIIAIALSAALGQQPTGPQSLASLAHVGTGTAALTVLEPTQNEDSLSEVRLNVLQDELRRQFNIREFKREWNYRVVTPLNSEDREKIDRELSHGIQAQEDPDKERPTAQLFISSRAGISVVVRDQPRQENTKTDIAGGIVIALLTGRRAEPTPPPEDQQILVAVMVTINGSLITQDEQVIDALGTGFANQWVPANLTEEGFRGVDVHTDVLQAATSMAAMDFVDKFFKKAAAEVEAAKLAQQEVRD